MAAIGAPVAEAEVRMHAARQHAAQGRFQAALAELEPVLEVWRQAGVGHGEILSSDRAVRRRVLRGAGTITRE